MSYVKKAYKYFLNDINPNPLSNWLDIRDQSQIGHAVLPSKL